MKSASYRLLASGLCLFILTPLCFAHPDDPKEKDRVPPYRGPAFQLPPKASLPSSASSARPGRGSMSTQAAGAGMQGPFPAQGITLRSWITLPEFAPQVTSGNDSWGYVSPGGHEYAIIGLSHGTAFVDVTDPGEPVQVALIAGPTSLWRDIKIYEDHAYAVSEGGSGIQVMSLANIDSGTVTLVNTITTGGTAKSHNVAIDEVSGTLYRLGGDANGLRIYALKAHPLAPGATKSNPVFIGSWTDRYIHDAEIVTYTSGPFANHVIAYCCSGFNGGFVETGLDVLDVTDPANIVSLDREFYPQASYSHQAWLSEDRNYLYLNDEVAGSDFNINSRAIIFDVSDPTNVVNVANTLNTSPAVTHNVYTRGNLLFAANYRSGLRVFDISNQTAPTEVAYFDTWPEDDGKNYNGLWNAYPLLPSGTIVGSDLERGLFIWEMGAPDVEFTYPQGFPETLASNNGSIPVTITPQDGLSIVPGSALLHFDNGNGMQTLPLVNTGGNNYTANFGSLPCGTNVEFYLSAQTEVGRTWRDPVAQPGGQYQLTVADNIVEIHHDAVEGNFGWAVGAAGDSATTGVWELVVPVGTAAAPSADASPDPANKCWVTGNGVPGGGLGDNDVDGGATTLTSPAMDATGDGIAYIHYARWYSNNTGGAPDTDNMPIYISNNNGSTWTLLETVTENAGNWVFKSFRIDEYVTPTANMKLRFVAQDTGDGSVVEAGVDELSITLVTCSDPVFCTGDLVDSGTFNPPSDGVVDGADLAYLLGEWGPNPGSLADIVDSGTFLPPPDGIVDGADLAFLLGAWGNCN